MTGGRGYCKDRLVENLKHLEVLDAVDCTHADAMAAWDKVFCSEWFRDQPAPEDADGGTRNAYKSPSRPVERGMAVATRERAALLFRQAARRGA
jgi:hypothetical protein